MWFSRTSSRSGSRLRALTLALLCIGLLWPAAQASRSSDPNQSSDYRILLKTRAFTPEPILDRAVGQVLADAGGEKRHFFIQLFGPATSNSQLRLESAGVRLISYLPHNAWLASVDTEQGLSSVMGDVVRWAGPVPVTDKLSPRLQTGEIAPWAQRENGFLGVMIHIYRDVPLEESASLIQRYGGYRIGELVSTNVLIAGMPEESLRDLAEEDSVMWIAQMPPPMTVVNDLARAVVHADEVQTAPYNLDGTGVQLLVYDGGMVENTHGDLVGRTTLGEGGSASYHATHVACTAGGTGANSAGQYRGMAPNVDIISYEYENCDPYCLYNSPQDIEANYLEAITTYGADLATNSIGSNINPNGYDCAWEGDYESVSQLVDQITRGSLGQPFMSLWAAGNERTGSARCGDFATIGIPATAKNNIAVGATDDVDAIASFTSWGPTDDGRLRPDVCAPGVDLYSCTTGNSYTTLSGTSMATPTTSGCASLILQQWAITNPTAGTPLPSTMKALLIHTADDIHNVGPDFETGYGRINVQTAVDKVISEGIFEDQVAQGETRYYDLFVAPGAPEFKVTVAWDDEPATIMANPTLVNDVDIIVIAPDSTTHYPWVLNPASPSTPATTGPDHVNVVEQVRVATPNPGIWQIQITGTNIPVGPQDISIVTSPDELQSSTGVVFLNAGLYNCASVVELGVSDGDLRNAGTQDVTIVSTSDPAGETVSLVESPVGSGIFSGSVQLVTTTPGAGQIQVAHGDTVTATYQDLDNGSGNPDTVQASSPVDCAGPVISNVQASLIVADYAIITWDTEEPSDSTVEIGEATPSTVFYDAGLTTSHSVVVTGLNACTDHVFRVSSVDAAGNGTLDNNGGANYTFKSAALFTFFSDDMEGGVGTFTHSGTYDQWEWGTPTSGPNAAHSGSSCWATNLSGNYTKNSTSTNGNNSLVTGPIDLTGVSTATLRFWHWFDIYTDGSTDDGAWVEIWDGAQWNYVEPDGGYNSDLDDEAPDPPGSGGAAWAGQSGGWEQAQFDLTPFVGNTVQVRFHFFEDDDYGTAGAGWYIDDVELESDSIPCQPSVSMVSFSLDDTPTSCTDFDGVVDAAELATVTFNLANGGGENAENASVTVTSDNSSFRVSNGTKDLGSFGGLGGSDSITVRVYARQWVACQETFNLNLHVDADGGYTYDTSIQLVANTDLIGIVGTEYDNVESNSIAWTHAPVSGSTDLWNRTTAKDHTSGSGMSWYCGSGSSYQDNMDAELRSPEYLLPATYSSSLTFWSWVFSEPNADGGWVEISTDGGSNWTTVTPTGGYPGTVQGGAQPAFTGSGATWVSANIDLSPYQGELVHVRFRWYSDGSVSFYPGWYLDDITFTDVATVVEGCDADLCAGGDVDLDVLLIPAETTYGPTDTLAFEVLGSNNLSTAQTVRVRIRVLDEFDTLLYRPANWRTVTVGSLITNAGDPRLFEIDLSTLSAIYHGVPLRVVVEVKDPTLTTELDFDEYGFTVNP